MEKFRNTAFLMNHDGILNTTFVNLNLCNDALLNFHFHMSLFVLFMSFV